MRCKFRHPLWLLPVILFAGWQSVWGSALGDMPRTATAEQFDSVLDEVLAAAERPTGLDLKDRYRIVFVPGILGSGLEIDGQTIWGGGISPTVDKLALRHGSGPADAVVLHEYPLGLARATIYGDFDRRLTAISGGSAPMEFAYDWRQSIDSIADQLEERLRSAEWARELNGRQVILLAHSMGGVVSWVWKDRHFKHKEYPFTLHRVILLGSPLAGSCEMLRVLLRGYLPPPEESALDQLYELAFSGLKAAAFTFPSVFELLPGDLTSCLRVEDKIGEHSLNHFKIDSWKQFLVPQLEARHRVNLFGWKWWRSRPSVWRELGLSRAQFEKLLQERLEAARDFRSRLGMMEDSVRGLVRYYYSDRHDTTAQLVLRDDANGPVLDHEDYDPGDGRVLKSSVICCLETGDHARWIDSGHGEMVQHGAVLNGIEDLVEDEVRQARLAVVVADQDLRRAYAKRGLLVDSTSLATTLEGEREETMSAVRQLNLETVAVLGLQALEDEWVDEDLGGSLLRYAARLRGDGSVETMLPILDLALEATGASVEQRALALSWQGSVLNELGRHGEAVHALSKISDRTYADNIALALAQLSTRQYDGALESSRQAAGQNSNDWLPPYYMGQAYTQKGQYRSAAERLNQALSRASNNDDRVTIYRQLGYVHEKQKRYDNAIAAYRSAGDEGGVKRARENKETDAFNKEVEREEQERAAIKAEEDRLREQLKNLPGAEPPPR